MIEIIPATSEDLATIKNLAYKIWPATYGTILSEKQLAYMLDLFYDESALQQNVIDNHQLILIKENDIFIGFADYEINYKDETVTRIHKIYLLPETQGKGFGKKLIQHIENKALEAKNVKLSLNVNRFNKAKDFYESQGFKIVFEEDIELDFGYLMEDFRMEKTLV
jgi:ribosomal protein S18 acetylase RimI-like enzyme